MMFFLVTPPILVDYLYVESIFRRGSEVPVQYKASITDKKYPRPGSQPNSSLSLICIHNQCARALIYLTALFVIIYVQENNLAYNNIIANYVGFCSFVTNK